MRIRETSYNLIAARGGVYLLGIPFCPIEEGEVGDGDGYSSLAVRWTIEDAGANFLYFLVEQVLRRRRVVGHIDRE